MGQQPFQPEPRLVAKVGWNQTALVVDRFARGDPNGNVVRKAAELGPVGSQGRWNVFAEDRNRPKKKEEEEKEKKVPAFRVGCSWLDGHSGTFHARCRTRSEVPPAIGAETALG